MSNMGKIVQFINIPGIKTVYELYLMVCFQNMMS